MLRILIATDNHLGFLENDAIRGHDSFVTFEEILEVGTKNNCDLIVLGGDLFHDNKPSQLTFYKTQQILKKYCCGDGDVNIKMITDSRYQPFSSAPGNCVNYEDPTIAIDLPIFMIHGNIIINNIYLYFYILLNY